jgi:hypothetical protein
MIVLREGEKQQWNCSRRTMKVVLSAQLEQSRNKEKKEAMYNNKTASDGVIILGGFQLYQEASVKGRVWIENE